MFSGLGMNLGNLSRLSMAKTRSISPENFTGEKGGGAAATEGTGAKYAQGFAASPGLGTRPGLGRGWKISPSIAIEPGQTFTLAEIDGSGAIQQIWMTPTGRWRFSILRIYWDDETQPSVECPVGDFFASGWGVASQVSSLAVCVNPHSGLNCYWEMPFRKRCRITMTNIDEESMVLYYQLNYTLTEVPDDCAYFHAQFRRVNPLPYGEVYTIVDGIKGHGQYIGTYMAWGSNSSGWWGEGEIKFYIDGDEEFPTICGTGTEDYFCGSYDFLNFSRDRDRYQEFTTPHSGLSQVLRPDGLFQSQQRFGMYRWHIMDPIRFERDLRVTIQALGWRKSEPRRYLPLQDDLASVGYWYQTLPAVPFPELPDRDELEII